jgi:hypothetical protein
MILFSSRKNRNIDLSIQKSYDEKMAARSESEEIFEIILVLLIISLLAVAVVYIAIRTGLLRSPELVAVQSSKNIKSPQDALTVCQQVLGAKASLASVAQVNEAVSQGAQYCNPGWVSDPTNSVWWPMQEADTTPNRVCGGGDQPGAYSAPSSQVPSPVANCMGIRPLLSSEAVAGDFRMLPWFQSIQTGDSIWSRSQFTTFGQ